jgi:vacuolar-type H+-ATPase subunit H
VVAGLLVAELARAREAQQRLLLALAHLARRVLDHVLEQARGLQHEVLAAQREQVAAAREAFARVDRLGEEVGNAGVERA